MRIVADTNTLVSGFGWRGAPARVLDAALRGEFTLVTSPPLLEELARVMRYPKLVDVFPNPDRIVMLLRSVADIVHSDVRLSVIADKPDNRVLEAALAGQADAIVSGDNDLLVLRRFRDIPILSSGEFLTLFTNQ